MSHGFGEVMMLAQIHCQVLKKGVRSSARESQNRQSLGLGPGQFQFQFQFVPIHGSCRSGVLNSTRNLITAGSPLATQAVEPCMCETSLDVQPIITRLHRVTLCFKIGFRGVSKLHRESKDCK